MSHENSAGLDAACESTLELSAPVRSRRKSSSGGVAVEVAPAPVPQVVAQSGRIPFSTRFPTGISWLVTGWMVGMHIAALAAFFFFSWQGLVTAIVLHFVSACLGITLGYHRLLTHGSLIVPNWLKYTLSLVGMLSAEGSPLMWVATHRKHHVHSDDEEDPHSPLDGFWWSHMVWFYPYKTAAEDEALFRRWAPDLYKDPVQMFFHKTFFFYPVILGVILYAVGQYFFQNGVSLVLWGLCLRMILAYHSTWFVNSATHRWGYQNYQTTDKSTNLWWVAIVAYGEGWHNNHHAHQRLAVHGHKWWEFDVTYNVIRLLKVLGLAKNVQDKLPETSDQSTIATAR
jgi:fatty-acid desaturase